MLKYVKDFVEEQKKRFNEKRKVQKKEVQESFVRAMRLFRLRLYEEALQDFLVCEARIGLFDKEGKKEVLLNTGNCLFNLGKHGEGERRYFHALNLDSNDADVLYGKGLAHLSICDLAVLKDDVKAELKELKSRMRWALTGEEKTRLGDAYLNLKRQHDFNKRHLRKAFDCFTKLVKFDRRNADCWYFFGLCCFFTNNKREAVDSFEVALMLNPSYSNESFPLELFDRVKLNAEHAVAAKDAPSREVGRYRTDRGVLVRSKAEALIDNFYFTHNVKARYEPTLVLGDRTVTPDWELDIEGVRVYHEHFGMDDDDYLRSMRAKIDLYAKHCKNLVWTTREDERDIEAVLKKKLGAFRRLERDNNG